MYWARLGKFYAFQRVAILSTCGRVLVADFVAVADAKMRFIYLCNPVALPAAPAVPGAYKFQEAQQGRQLFSPTFEALARCIDRRGWSVVERVRGFELLRLRHPWKIMAVTNDS